MSQSSHATAQRRRPRVGTLIFALALILAVPAGALAAHSFTDVPNGHTFHSNIANLYNARITTGCTPTTYCPDEPVTRAQMAGFLNRGLGRATTDEGSIQVDGSGTYTVASVTIRTGGVPGGTGFVFLTGGVNLSVYQDGLCPCSLGLSISGTDAQVLYASLPDIDMPFPLIVNGKWQSVSNNTVDVVSSGTEYTYNLRLNLNATSGSNDAFALWGQISAVYVPFGWQGTNQLAPVVIKFDAPAQATP